jgi:hypothetical protein
MTNIKYLKELVTFLEKKPIQFRVIETTEWFDLLIPEEEYIPIKIDEWKGNVFEFRIKPKMIYYRTALMKDRVADKFIVLSRSAEKAEDIKNSLFSTNNILFVKWLTDIITVELDN